jgi:sucrose-6F-phosphate phosphohydrolase
MSTTLECRLLICTDLDRTLIPNGMQPESPPARRYFATLAGREEVTLCYVSGRHRDLVEEAIVNYRLPQPDFVIGDVGTTIYALHAEKGWTPLADWQDEIAPDWQGRTHEDLKALLEGMPEIRPQEYHKQNRFKLSYYLPVQADIEALRSQISKRLTSAGIRASQIYSIDEPGGIGLLDILPARATKFHAVEFLMQQQGFGLDNTVFCGDSGNDLEVLVSPIAAVLVANSSAEVQATARETAEARGLEDRLYIARGGLRSMNGNYAAGMLEGIAHYHPHIVGWLEVAGERASSL